MEMELEYETLDFMISAPSQGVVAISSRVDDVETKAILQKSIIKPLKFALK